MSGLSRRGRHRLVEVAVASWTGLTTAQITAVCLAAQGMTKEQAALELGLSVNTIKTHLRHAAEELDTRTVAQTVAACIGRGIISAEGKPLARSVFEPLSASRRAARPTASAARHAWPATLDGRSPVAARRPA